MSKNLKREAEAQARKNYQRLPEPKTCDLSTYVAHWIKETSLREKIKKTTKKIRLDDSADDPFARALADYFSVLPAKEIQPLRQKILALPYTKRERAWKKLSPLIKKLERLFIQLAIARNKFARKKRHPSYTELVLAIDQIPNSDYKRFIQNTNAAIDLIHKQLPQLTNLPNWFYSPLNLPCFICQTPSLASIHPEKVMALAKKKYPLLKRFQKKISVQTGRKTQIMYHKETDNFKITLSKNDNQRHRAIELAHELGHIVAMLKNFQEGKSPLETGRYQAEKEAAEIELKLLRALSPTAFRARLGNILLILHRVLFELAIYAKPKRNLAALYAATLNRCFQEASQKKNELYLLDERIVLRPLSPLPQAIAYTKVLIK